MTDDDVAMLLQRCAALEQQLAEEQAAAEAALSVVYAAGEENARIQLGLPVQRQPPRRRRGHLRGLSAIVLFGMLATVAFHAVAYGGLRAHSGRRPYATAASLGADGALRLAREGAPARPL